MLIFYFVKLKWYIILYKFRVYNKLIWYTYMLQNDYHCSLVNSSVTSQIYHFFFVETIKIQSFYIFE